ncbi:MAG: hypothetical protein U5K75_02270 [Ahrensia sp.]|nr:hypothetical protein [Ahrensia sp.]
MAKRVVPIASAAQKVGAYPILGDIHIVWINGDRQDFSILNARRSQTPESPADKRRSAPRKAKGILTHDFCLSWQHPL